MIHPLLELTDDRTGGPMLINPNDISTVRTINPDLDTSRTQIAVGNDTFARYLFSVETPAQIRDAIQALRHQQDTPIGPTAETGGLGFGTAIEGNAS